MTDERNHESRSRGAGCVWLCGFEHRYGLDVWVCETEGMAYAVLAGACRRSWAEARELDADFIHDESEPPLPEAPPLEDREAVRSYFAVMNDADPMETYWVESQDVLHSTGEASGPGRARPCPGTGPRADGVGRAGDVR
jgi:hypothetical protein